MASAVLTPFLLLNSQTNYHLELRNFKSIVTVHEECAIVRRLRVCTVKVVVDLSGITGVCALFCMG